MPSELSGRTVIISAMGGRANLDAPVKVKLGLFDDRVLSVTSWAVRDGSLVLTLDDKHDEFPVGRCMLAGPDGVRRTLTEHKRRGGFPLPGEKRGAHLPEGGQNDE